MISRTRSFVALVPSLSVLSLLCGLLFAGVAQAETPEQAAFRVMDEFLAAFNNQDLDRWRATLHYPHVRFASGIVDVAATPEAYAGPETFVQLKKSGWHHSHWGARQVVQQGPDKVHVAVQFTRYDEDNNVIGVFDSLYIVTKQNGRWGILSRSSFAP